MNADLILLAEPGKIPHTTSDVRLLVAVVLSIGVIIALITRLKMHPFLALLLGSGTLAAVVSASVRDRGTTQGPLAQALLYPATDLRMVDPSYRLFADGFFLTARDMHFYRDRYAPRAEQWSDPRASPAMADRFDGLPPTRIWTAGFDPLRDEGERYGRSLADSGVRVTALREPSMVHGYFSMGLLPGGLQRTADMCRAVGALVRSGR